MTTTNCTNGCTDEPESKTSPKPPPPELPGKPRAVASWTKPLLFSRAKPEPEPPPEPLRRSPKKRS